MFSHLKYWWVLFQICATFFFHSSSTFVPFHSNNNKAKGTWLNSFMKNETWNFTHSLVSLSSQFPTHVSSALLLRYLHSYNVINLLCTSRALNYLISLYLRYAFSQHGIHALFERLIRLQRKKNTLLAAQFKIFWLDTPSSPARASHALFPRHTSPTHFSHHAPPIKPKISN